LCVLSLALALTLAPVLVLTPPLSAELLSLSLVAGREDVVIAAVELPGELAID
jgi:hypothetical protein